MTCQIRIFVYAVLLHKTFGSYLLENLCEQEYLK